MKQNEIIRLAGAKRDGEKSDISAWYDQQHQRDRQQQEHRAEAEGKK